MLIFQLIIIQAITFVALVFVLRKIMYSASYLETKRLQQLNEENTKKVQEATLKVKEADNQCREKILAAEAEAKRLKTQAQEEAEKLKEEVLGKAKEAAERITASALNSKERIREELEARMPEKVIDSSYKILSAILSSKNQSLLHEGFITEIIQEIENIDPGKLAVTTDKGELFTSRNIDKEKKEKIEQILIKKTGKKIALEEKLDEKIIAGIIIKLGSLLIDGSLSGKLKEAAEALKKS